MDISFIISHYDDGNNLKYIKSFVRTIESIHEQKETYDIEIIIADDGSSNSGELQNIANDSYIISDKKKIYHLFGNRLSHWLSNTDFYFPEISNWLYLPKDKPCMYKARLGNVAVSIAKSENIFILDDDNVFITQNSIRTSLKLLQKFDLVIGQIKDKNGHLRPYSSHRVQGTTIGLKKTIIEQIGGFGEWTENVSSGVDSDLWWKLFHHFKKYPELKACYTSKIQTLDSCSKRWKLFSRKFFHHSAVANEFHKKYKCKNYRSMKHNPSRNKILWIEDLT